MTGQTWPREWGPDTPLDRARTAARVYRDAALSPNPTAEVAIADRVFTAFREAWLFPIVDTGSEWIDLHQFAALAGMRVRGVRKWYEQTPSWGPPPERRNGHVRRVDAVAYLDRRAGIDLPEAA